MRGLGGLLEAGGGRASFTKGGRNWFWGMWVVDHRRAGGGKIGQM